MRTIACQHHGLLIRFVCFCSGLFSRSLGPAGFRVHFTPATALVWSCLVSTSLAPSLLVWLTLSACARMRSVLETRATWIWANEPCSALLFKSYFLNADINRPELPPFRRHCSKRPCDKAALALSVAAAFVSAWLLPCTSFPRPRSGLFRQASSPNSRPSLTCPSVCKCCTQPTSSTRSFYRDVLCTSWRYSRRPPPRTRLTSKGRSPSCCKTLTTLLSNSKAARPNKVLNSHQHPFGSAGCVRSRSAVSSSSLINCEIRS
jgi:hypothetical protein